MQLGCTQMHSATLAAIVIELVLLGAQTAMFLQRPHDRTSLGYVVLLVLLIVFNTANGLLPNPQYAIPLPVQHILVNTAGFAIVSYFPFYFYRALGLEKLRFLAVYGVPLFLLLPYLAFFLVGLSVHGDVEFAHRYGFIVPTVYALVLLAGIGRAIRFAYREHRNRSLFIEETAAYIAIMPWAFIAPVVYFQWGQLAETLFTNLGFLAVSVFLVYRSVSLVRAEKQLLSELELVPSDRDTIERNSLSYGLSNREREILHLICERLGYKQIADKLNISDRTVGKHVENIFLKMGVNSRAELVRKVNDQ